MFSPSYILSLKSRDCEPKAPLGKYRLVFSTPFYYGNGHVDDYPTLEEAIKKAKAYPLGGGTFYIYDSKGETLYTSSN